MFSVWGYHTTGLKKQNNTFVKIQEILFSILCTNRLQMPSKQVCPQNTVFLFFKFLFTVLQAEHWIFNRNKSQKLRNKKKCCWSPNLILNGSMLLRKWQQRVAVLWKCWEIARVINARDLKLSYRRICTIWSAYSTGKWNLFWGVGSGRTEVVEGTLLWRVHAVTVTINRPKQCRFNNSNIRLFSPLPHTVLTVRIFKETRDVPAQSPNDQRTPQ